MLLDFKFVSYLTREGEYTNENDTGNNILYQCHDKQIIIDGFNGYIRSQPKRVQILNTMNHNKMYVATINDETEDYPIKLRTSHVFLPRVLLCHDSYAMFELVIAAM